MNQRALVEKYVVGTTIVGLRPLTHEEIIMIADHVVSNHGQDYPNFGSNEYGMILFTHYHAVMRDELNLEDLKNKPTQAQGV